MAIVGFYAAEAFRLHGVSRVDPSLREADALRKRLQDKFGHGEFQVREVLELNVPSVVTADQVRSLLAILRENAHLDEFEQKGSRGHKKTYYRLCPD